MGSRSLVELQKFTHLLANGQGQILNNILTSNFKIVTVRISKNWSKKVMELEKLFLRTRNHINWSSSLRVLIILLNYDRNTNVNWWPRWRYSSTYLIFTKTS